LDHDAVIDLLISTSGVGNALRAAAAFGRKRVINMLLDHDANADLSGGDMGNCIVTVASNLTVDIPEGIICRIFDQKCE
jgi:ankyrin repeat protein